MLHNTDTGGWFWEVDFKEGALINKTTIKGGAYWKKDAKSNHYDICLHEFFCLIN